MFHDYSNKSLELYGKEKGVIKTFNIFDVANRDALSTVYTPGVGAVSQEIFKDPEKASKLTLKGRMVAVITDGSAVLGLGNLGAEAAIPVMEGKCVLFKKFADIDAFPIAIKTQNVEEFVQTVKNICPVFGAINLEDISAPRCFEIEERLKKELDIPVMHDDQHGTAIVVLAGLINATKVVGKKIEDLKVLINGTGAAGTAIGRLLLLYGIKNIIFVDSQGSICRTRAEINKYKKALVDESGENPQCDIPLEEMIAGRDVFIGVSRPDLLTEKMIKSMGNDPIIFALANPVPEIMPDEAKKFGAKVVATGRSDFPNQINNALVFPGIFHGVFRYGKKEITDEMKLKAAKALADIVENPTSDQIIPDIFDKKVMLAISDAMRE